MQLTPVKNLGNEELVNELYGIGQMDGGDLALPRRYEIRRDAAKREILRRMRRYGQSEGMK